MITSNSIGGKFQSGSERVNNNSRRKPIKPKTKKGKK